MQARVETQPIPRIKLTRRIAAFAKKNAVFLTAVTAAVITSFVIPPDVKYADYFDFRTLACLFSVLAVVCALRNVGFFTFLARKIVTRFHTTRSCFLALAYVTFIGSMFIANDMALITFLPLGWLILSETDRREKTAFLFVIQNIAANLGGMLTPFGNPQNLYLYSYFEIPTLEFMSIMLVPFLVAVALITVCCLLAGGETLHLTNPDTSLSEPVRTSAYLVLFALSIAIVFRGVPYIIGTIIIVAALLFLDRKALAAVDYPLLGTFAAFFIFAGNMARIEAVRRLFSAMMRKSTLLFSILSCQIISNVPSAILLSQFTDDYAQLLRGVNIGGTGTLIASLASLITFREYQKQKAGTTRRYILVFTGLNALFLVILTAVAYFC